MKRNNRKPLRLRDYDYTHAGAYFVTICTHNRVCMFGSVVNGEMHLNAMGGIVQAVWEGLPLHYANVELDAFVIMPNHVHGIVLIGFPNREMLDTRGNGRGGFETHPYNPNGMHPQQQSMTICRGRFETCPYPSTKRLNRFDETRSKQLLTPIRRHGLPEIVRALKTFSARRINELRGVQGVPVWQRNYYEHIIRSEKALTRARQYIQVNPAKWGEDRENPSLLDNQ